MVRFRGFPIVIGLLVVLFLAGCGGAQSNLEPAAQEKVPSEVAEVEFSSAEDANPEATAIPMPVETQAVIGGGIADLVEAPLLNEPILDLELDDVPEEDSGSLSEGETYHAEGGEVNKIEIGSKEGRIAYAQKNLAENLGVGVDGVHFVGYENKIWPDGNLGCPQKGKRFTPTEIQGYIIRFKVGDHDYVYHGGAGRLPFQCAERSDVNQPSREMIIPPPDK